jgi:hypothetical protein
MHALDMAFLKLLPQSGSFRTMEIQGGTTMLAQGRDGLGRTAYERHQPEQTLLYQLVEAHYSALIDHLDRQGNSLPDHVHREFEAYLKCGRLEHGFLRVRCDKCHFERLVPFSCKKRGFCPSCGARRMAETAALLADEVFPDADWQRCAVHFYRNVFSHVPRGKMREVAAMLKAIHAQENRDAAESKSTDVIQKLKDMKLKAAAEMVEKSIHETFAYFAYPSQHWIKIRTNNPMERLLKEARRRTKVVGAFPDGNSALMLVAARLRHVSSTTWGTRKYMNMQLLNEMDQEAIYSVA